MTSRGTVLSAAAIAALAAAVSAVPLNAQASSPATLPATLPSGGPTTSPADAASADRARLRDAVTLFEAGQSDQAVASLGGVADRRAAAVVAAFYRADDTAPALPRRRTAGARGHAVLPGQRRLA